MLTAEEESLLGGASPFSSWEDKAVAYEVIEQEISRWEEVIQDANEKIRSWRQQRNALSIISRLHADILAEIFSVLIRSTGVIYHKHFSLENRSSLPRNLRQIFRGPEWLSLSHVCRKWRLLMLETPLLWNEPHFGHPIVGELMLGRAKDVPLISNAIFVNYLSQDASSQEKLVFENLKRTKALTLRDVHYPVFHISRGADIIERLQRDPAPILESLYVSSILPFSTNQLPHALFSGNHPKLRHMTLSHWVPRWEKQALQALSNLTTLRILHKIEDRSIKLGISLFVSGLKWLCNLEELGLRQSLMDPEGAAASQHGPKGDQIQLPRLRMYEVAETAPVIKYLARYIWIPETTLIRARLMGSSVTLASTRLPSQSLGYIVNRLTIMPRQVPLVFAHILLTGENRPTVVLRTASQHRVTPSGFWLEPQIVISDTSAEASTAFSEGLLFIHGIKYVAVEQPIGNRAWMDLALSRTLVGISCHAIHLQNIIELLSDNRIRIPDSQARTDNSGKAPFVHSSSASFPALKHLLLFKIVFSTAELSEEGKRYLIFRDVVAGTHGTCVDSRQILFQELVKCIRDRKRLLLGPDAITLQQCANVEEHLVVDLRALVHLVIV